MQMDRCSTSSEISFHGLPSKNKRPSIRKQIALLLSSKLIVLLFLGNSHLQRDVQQTFFHQYFCELSENSCSASKKCSLELFRKLRKNTCGKSYFSKVAGFYRSSQQRWSVQKGILRKVFSKFTGKHLCQRLYFNKVAGLRLQKRDFSTSVFL